MRHYLPAACVLSCVMMHATLAPRALADGLSSVSTRLGDSHYAGQAVLIRNADVFFQSDAGKTPAEKGRLYFVEEVRADRVRVAGQPGWLDRSSIVLANDAAEFFTDRLYDDPSPENYLARGQSWWVQRRFERALSDYRAALALDPSLAIAENGVGNCLLELGDYPSAIKAYTRAISLVGDNVVGDNVVGDNVVAYTHRGNAWQILGDHAKALSDYQTAWEQDPSAIRVVRRMGISYSAMGKPDAAIGAWNAYLAARPEDARGWYQRGMAHRNLGAIDKALRDFTQVTQIDPGHFDAYNELAWLLANGSQTELRSPPLAVQAATQACEITHYRLWYCLGTLAAAHARNGDFDQAVTIQKKAISLLPADCSPSDRTDYDRRLQLYRKVMRQSSPSQDPLQSRAPGQDGDTTDRSS